MIVNYLKCKQFDIYCLMNTHFTPELDDIFNARGDIIAFSILLLEILEESQLC